MVLAGLKTLGENYLLVVLVVLGVLVEMRADPCLVVAVTSQMKTFVVGSERYLQKENH